MSDAERDLKQALLRLTFVVHELATEDDKKVRGEILDKHWAPTANLLMRHIDLNDPSIGDDENTFGTSFSPYVENPTELGEIGS